MTDTTATQKPRPVFRNIHITEIVKYRLPPAGMVSIGHRISGVMMFLLLPFVVWLFDVTLTSEVSYGQFTSAYTAGLGVFPAWIVKLVTLALIWAYLHHFIAGVRHLWMDVSHKAVEKGFGHSSALVTLGLAGALTLVLGFRLFF
jgi:succinate dehydrogenase / fumarate reductase, cytochrome b subunit